MAFADNVVRSYHAESGKLLATLKGHRSRVTHLEVPPPLPTPTRVAQPASDQQLYSFSSSLLQSLLFNSTVRRSLTRHSCVRCGHLTEQFMRGWCGPCGWVSPAGDALLSTSADAVLLWDLKSLYKKRTLQGGPYGTAAQMLGARCPPRHPTHFEPSFRDDSNDIICMTGRAMFARPWPTAP